MTAAARFIRLAAWSEADGGARPDRDAVRAGGRAAGGGPDRLILGDALAVARALPAGEAQLVYLDPPFFTRTVRQGRARAQGDTPAYEDRWSGGLGAYLDWLAALMEAAHRLLTPRGSLFLHLDHHAVHGAKLVADAVFGPGRLMNEIIWHYGTGGRTRRHFPRKHDTILWYARGTRPAFHPDAVAVDRRVCPLCGQHREQWNHLRRQVDADGRVYRTIRSAGKVYRYYDDEPVLPPDVWLDVPHLQQKDPERTGWPTQKPERLLERILRAVTQPGDLVVDLVAGSGTTLAAARRLGRPCLGVDASAEAVRLAWERLTTAPAPGRGGGGEAPGARHLALELFGGTGGASVGSAAEAAAEAAAETGSEAATLRRPAGAQEAGLPGAPRACWMAVQRPGAGRAAALVTTLLR